MTVRTLEAGTAEPDRAAAVVASEWIVELLAEPAPEWHVVAHLADELHRIASEGPTTSAGTSQASPKPVCSHP